MRNHAIRYELPLRLPPVCSITERDKFGNRNNKHHTCSRVSREKWIYGNSYDRTRSCYDSERSASARIPFKDSAQVRSVVQGEDFSPPPMAVIVRPQPRSLLPVGKLRWAPTVGMRAPRNTPHARTGKDGAGVWNLSCSIAPALTIHQQLMNLGIDR